MGALPAGAGISRRGVNLPAHPACGGTRLPGKEISFVLCPCLPAGRDPTYPARGGTGHIRHIPVNN